MDKQWIARWDERYKAEDYAYGVVPNEYFKEQLDKLPLGKLLLPAEGEGRNAVYAAKNGWEVYAFDISKEGMAKALKLATLNKVTINYTIDDWKSMYSDCQFDVIGLIYAHFPAELKSDYHKHFVKLLRKGGTVIIEAFSKKHLEYISKNEKVGGPRDIDILFSMEEIEEDFPGFKTIELIEKEIELKEGLYHNGVGSVLRFVGKK